MLSRPSLRTGQAGLPHPALPKVSALSGGWLSSLPKFLQVEQLQFGEVTVGPSLVVTPASAATSAVALAQDSAQAAPDVAVESAEGPAVAAPEVTVPAAQHRVERIRD